MNKKIPIILFISALTVIFFNTSSTSAISLRDEVVFSQNSIYFYNPDECEISTSSGNIAICGAELPDETISILERLQIKEKAEANMDRYKYAEEKTSLPWQVLAAIHYREAGMASDRTIFDGERLAADGECYTNVDGMRVCSDPNEDAKSAAEHYINMLKEVYGIDIIADPSAENYAWGFLAYNRGRMYQCHGNVSYDRSPYVMNFYDNDHWSMPWVEGVDNYNCSGNRVNSTGGVVDQNLGALTVLAYLCGDDTIAGTSSSSTSSSSSSSSNVSAQGIVRKARELSWPEENSNNSLTAPTDTFTAAASEVGTDPSSNDCLNFVQTVIRASGVDPNLPIGAYPNPDEYQIVEYMDQSDKWERVNVSAESDLQPGDILISAVGDGSGQHVVGKNHIFIYLGSGRVASANSGKHYSRVGNLSEEWDPNSENDTPFKYGNNSYQIFRLSSGGCTTYEGEYPHYAQGEEPWGSMSYGPRADQTYATSACGAASMAMLVTYATGQDVFPNDIGDLLGNRYYWDGSGVDLDLIVAEKYGLEVIKHNMGSYPQVIQEMTDYLNQGYMLHFSGGGEEFRGYPFSKGGHFIGVFGWTGDGDNVIIADSAGHGNDEISLHDLVYAGAHYKYTAIKNNNSISRISCNNNYCSPRTQRSNTGNNDILRSVEEIIELANKNGSTYGYGQNRSISAFDAMLNGAPINTDCTGFASLVIYKTYGTTSIFDSSSIFSNPHYEEVPRSEVQPGDIFAYTSPQGHGGIVIEASNGVVTKIAETGGTEGRSGNNDNIGYSGPDSFSVTNMNGPNGHFFRWKGN